MTFAAPPEPEDAARRLASEQAARADSDAAADALRRLEAITAEAIMDLPVDDLVGAIAERIVDVLDAEVAIVQIDDEQRLTIAARRGERAVTIDHGRGGTPPPGAESTRMRAGVHPVSSDAPSVLRDYARHHDGSVASATAPLKIGARQLGTVLIAKPPARPFTREEVGVLQLAADRIAVSLDRASSRERERWARRDAEQAHRQVERLYRLTTELIVLDDERAIGERLLDEVLGPSGAATGAVYERDELTARLRRVANRGGPREGWQHANGTHLALTDEGAAARATRTARGVVLHADPVLGADAPRDATRMAVPLLTTDGTARGALVLGFDEVDAPMPDREWLRAIAGQGALAFERRRLAAERARMYAAERAARAQAEAREQAARILDGMGEGIVLIDRNGIVRIWNPAAASITGIPASAIIGSDLNATQPQLAAAFAHAPLDVDPRSPSSREVLAVRMDDDELWLSASAMTTRDGVVIAFRDVTETHAVERLRSELVATVSHELRTPIAGVLGAVKTLRDDQIELGAQTRAELLAMIDDQAERLASIVEDMLQVNRLDNGTEPVRAELVDLEDVARVAIETHRRRGVDVAADGAADTKCLVLGDRVRIGQVLDNLIDNAAAYADGSRVLVRVARDAADATITVRDFGPGIPPNERSRIFEKFYRLDPDMRRDRGGNGLGLYICRRIVERMGGSIHLDENVVDGAAFVVCLPAHDEFEDERP